jgi:hypothetical protein
MEEMKRFATETSFGEFCQILENKDGRQGGEDLCPSSLWMHIALFYPELGRCLASGGTVEIEGPSSGDIKMERRDTSGFDKDVSHLLLTDVRQAKIDFPNAAKKYRDILARAEGIWSGLAK